MLDRIFDRCIVNERGCWIWQGPFDVRWGYGKTKVGSRRDGTRRTVRCHLATYQAKYGPVPQGLELDHFVCDTPICCNPDHVKPVTPRENTLRSNSPSAINARRETCVRGHPFDQEYRGWRRCGQCAKERAAEWRARRSVY